jgi:hypothetical protein
MFSRKLVLRLGLFKEILKVPKEFKVSRAIREIPVIRVLRVKLKVG